MSSKIGRGVTKTGLNVDKPYLTAALEDSLVFWYGNTMISDLESKLRDSFIEIYSLWIFTLLYKPKLFINSCNSIG